MYLTSLLEVSVCDAVRPDAKPSVIRISMEPTFVALGPAHAALGMNNHVFYHSIASPACPLIDELARPAPAPACPVPPVPGYSYSYVPGSSTMYTYRVLLHQEPYYYRSSTRT